MWGLKPSETGKFDKNHKAQQQNLAKTDQKETFSVKEKIDRFFILGQWMAPLRSCLDKLALLPKCKGCPCKAKMESIGFKINLVDGITTFDFTLKLYKEWHA